MMRAFANWTEYPPYSGFTFTYSETIHERSSRGQIDGQLHGQGRLPVRVENVGEPLLLFVCSRIENYTKRATGL